MLQLYQTPLVQEEENRREHDAPFAMEPSLADFIAIGIGFLRRQFPIIISVMPLTIGLAVAYLYNTQPLYTAQAKILIDTGKVQVVGQPIFGDNPISGAIVDSQIELLKSDNFALSIIRNLHLTNDPEFVAPREGTLGKAIRRLMHPFSSNSAQSESLLVERVLAQLKRRLTVGRVGLTYVIDIDFQSANPDRAAELANAIAEDFVHSRIEARYQTIGRATAWLQDRMNELRVQASVAEHAVVEYKAKNNIVDSGGGHLINEQQLAELNTALVKAHADTVEAKARLDRVSQIVNGENLEPTTAELATVADALHSEIISKLRQQYLELAQREALLSNRVGRDHLAVVNIRNQMREIRRSTFDEFKRIAQAYKSDYDIARTREDSLQTKLNMAVAGSQAASGAQVELRQLESGAQSYRALYDSFQKRYDDFVQQQSFPLSEAQVTPALPPSSSSSPKTLRILGMACAGGLALGFSLALLREIRDRVFRTGHQLEARLKIECIGVLPIMRLSSKDGSSSVKNKTGANLSAARVIQTNSSPIRYVVDSPLSQFAEAIRAVKVAIDLNNGIKSNKVVGITSSLPDEGKSMIAASLAQLCAQSGGRSILVDCDLRKRSLSHELAPNATAGIVEVLTEAAHLDGVLWSDPSTKLSFLPVVIKSRLAHTNEVLASAAMKRLFARLQETYDYVIVDLSPLVPVVDVRAATHLIDSYIFVVEWGKTKIDIVERAFNANRGVYDRVLGTILNKVDFNRLGRYDHSAYYYSRYGYYAE
jgi:succinoglycan biosynthesis transport protein ExoP